MKEILEHLIYGVPDEKFSLLFSSGQVFASKGLTDIQLFMLF